MVLMVLVVMVMTVINGAINNFTIHPYMTRFSSLYQ